MKKQKIYLLLDSKRYHWKVGTTLRTVLIRLSEIISVKKRKHKILGYIIIDTDSKTGAECIAKRIQFEYERNGGTVIGNDYFIKKDNKENIIKDFITVSDSICKHLKIEYEWVECQ